MAGFMQTLREMIQELEQASTRPRGSDDLRTRLGYTTEDDEFDAEFDADELAPEALWTPETSPAPETYQAPRASRAPAEAYQAASGASRTPAKAYQAASRASRTPFPSSAPLPRSDMSLDDSPSKRIRAHLRAPDGLSTALVMKELLDKPLGLRRKRQGK